MEAKRTVTVVITLTTINKPIILEALIKDFNDTGQQRGNSRIVMGDRKSPSENKSYCAGLECPPLFSISYFLEIEQQETHFAKEYPRLYKHIPENSLHVGILSNIRSRRKTMSLL